MRFEREQSLKTSTTMSGSSSPPEKAILINGVRSRRLCRKGRREAARAPAGRGERRDLHEPIPEGQRVLESSLVIATRRLKESAPPAPSRPGHRRAPTLRPSIGQQNRSIHAFRKHTHCENIVLQSRRARQFCEHHPSFRIPARQPSALHPPLRSDRLTSLQKLSPHSPQKPSPSLPQTDSQSSSTRSAGCASSRKARISGRAGGAREGARSWRTARRACERFRGLRRGSLECRKRGRGGEGGRVWCDGWRRGSAAKCCVRTCAGGEEEQENGGKGGASRRTSFE